jgi:hypothetical protein
LNIEVARDSKLIALATGRDSIAMKMIAILTIAFLPGTFVAVGIVDEGLAFTNGVADFFLHAVI